MSRRGLLLLFVAAFASFAILRLPLAAAIAPFDMIAARQVSGTLWRGRLGGAVLAGRPIGDAELSLSAWALLLGRLRLAWELRGEAFAGDGILERRPGGGLRLAEASLSGPVQALLPDLPLGGTFRFRIAELALDREGCLAASGEVWTDAPARSPALGGWQGPEIAGELACEDGALVLPLAGDAAARTLALRLRLDAAGELEIAFDPVSNDESLGRVLPALGFRHEDGAWRIRTAVALAP